MSLPNLVPLALGVFVLTLLLMAVATRRFCQRCDYCGQFYWWIGWAAFEWTSAGCESWAMRCKHCRWLTRELGTAFHDILPP